MPTYFKKSSNMSSTKAWVRVLTEPARVKDKTGVGSFRTSPGLLLDRRKQNTQRPKKCLAGEEGKERKIHLMCLAIISCDSILWSRDTYRYLVKTAEAQSPQAWI